MKEEDEVVKRIKKWLKGKTAPPYMLEIWPTFECNLNCVYCWRRVHDLRKIKQRVSEERYLEILNEASNIGIRRVEVVGGGEPMKFPRIIEIIKRIKLSEMIGTMTTNGTLFNEKSVRTMVEMKWDLIAISLDGPNEEIHDKIRGRGAFKKVINTLRLFKYWKRRLKTHKPEIIFVPVLSKLNYEYIPQFFYIAKKFDVKVVDFKPLILYGGAFEKYKIKENEYEDIRKIILKSLRIARKYKIDTNLSEYLNDFFVMKSPEVVPVMKEKAKKNFLKIPCFMPWYFLKIYAEEGCAGPCLVPDKLHMMNINKYSLEEVWYSEKFDKLRKMMRNNIVPSFCSRCCGGSLFDNEKIRLKLSKILKKKKQKFKKKKQKSKSKNIDVELNEK